MQIQRRMIQLTERGEGQRRAPVSNIDPQLTNSLARPDIECLPPESPSPFFTIEHKPGSVDRGDTAVTRVAALSLRVVRQGKSVFPSDIIPVVNMKCDWNYPGP